MEFNIRQFTGNANVIKFFRQFFRFVIPLGAITFLAYTLYYLPSDVYILWKGNLKLTPSTAAMLICLVVLSYINWAFEALKWRLLSGKLEQMSFHRAFSGVMYGVTLGMITPKRSGEFLGRSMMLLPANRLQGIVVNMAGSLSQLSVTLIVGLLSMAMAMMIKAPDSTFFLYALSSRNPALAVALSALMLVVIAFFGIHPLRRKILKIAEGNTFVGGFKIFWEIEKSEVFALIGWSMLRYFVFAIQFYVILKIFLVPINMGNSFLLLAITYLFLSPLPISALVEAGVRGSVVILVYDLFFADKTMMPAGIEISLVAAMLGLWVVNLAMPALAGALLGATGRGSLKKSAS